ncbi:hypothetical protein DPSP01_000338 [Paraphaeosphaeria sporulosa]
MLASVVPRRTRKPQRKLLSMRYIIFPNHPTHGPQLAEGDMAYTSNQSEGEYAASIDQRFGNGNGWWPPILTTQQSDTGFTATVTPQYSPNTTSCDNLVFQNVGFPSPNPCNVRSFHPDFPRRHTLSGPEPIGYGYGIHHEIYAPESVPAFTLANYDVFNHQFSPPNFESGLMSPSVTTPSSRPSITSLKSHSSTASHSQVNQKFFNTQCSPIPGPSFLGGPYPYSPTFSDQSPTQSQVTQPPKISQPEELYERESRPSPLPEETTFCLVPGCGSRFTGEYQKGNLKRHHKSNHPELLVQNGESPGDPKKLKCSVCSHIFKRSDARKKHEYRTHHLGPKPPRKIRYTAP